MAQERILDWVEVQKLHDSGMTLKGVGKFFNISVECLRKKIKKGKLIQRYHKQILSESTKNLMSERKKQWCRENPDKLNWKKADHFKSPPCEHFKSKLSERGIPFVEEYQPLQDRFFSIDIAFPDKKIGIEINGNQHYDRDGNLKPYYQERHNLIERNGWRLLELHYVSAWDEKVLNSTVKFLTENVDFSVSYSEYFKNKRKVKVKSFKKRISFRPEKEILISMLEKDSVLELSKKMDIPYMTIRGWAIYYNILKKRETPPKKYCSLCREGIVNSKTGLCKSCYPKTKRIIERPSASVLTEEIQNNSWEFLGRKYGISGNAIKKWAKAYGIEIIPRKASKKRFCKKCETPLLCPSRSGYCSVCWNVLNKRVDRPLREVLEKEIENNSWTELGRKYGVSDNAVKKWAKTYGIEIMPRIKRHEKEFCRDCGKAIGYNTDTGRCKSCYLKSTINPNKPSVEQIMKDREIMTHKQMSEKYKISTARIKYWIAEAKQSLTSF